MVKNQTGTQNSLAGVSELDLLVALDVGSARVGCAVVALTNGRPVILAAETAASYGIRGGEIIDINRAAESIRIAIQAAADRAEADVKTVVVGLSGDVKLSIAKASVELDKERRVVTAGDVFRLRRCIAAEIVAGRRVIHRFDGPYAVGDLSGVEHPEGLCGDKLEMQASFLSASGDRLDNLLKAVHSAGVDIEAVALEPMACSLGVLSPDERALGAAVLDLGAGAFRGALWEGGRLRQIHVVGADAVPSGSGRALAGAGAPVGGMESVVLALARRFRIAPATAERLLRSHGALEESELATLPPFAEVAAVDGLGGVRVETLELARTIEEMLTPVARSLREGLSGFSAGHTCGVVLAGGGARIRGMAAWMSKRFGGAPVRVGTPRWKVDEGLQITDELTDSRACSLSGLIALGAEGRAQTRRRWSSSIVGRLGQRIWRLTASL
jgi:cell division protein FtsA